MIKSMDSLAGVEFLSKRRDDTVCTVKLMSVAFSLSYVCWHLLHTESDELAFIFDSISNLVKVRAGG